MKKAIVSIAVSCLFTGLLFVAFTAYAKEQNQKEQYIAEVSAMYNRSEASDDFKGTTTALAAEIFFAPVKTANHPYAEAAFLERIGSGFLMAALQDAKGTTASGDGMAYVAGVNIARPGFPLAIQVLYTTSKLDYDAPSNATYKTNGYGVSVGGYLKDNFLAGIEYMNRKTELSAGFFPMDFKTTDYALFTKYIAQLAGNRYLNLEGSLGQSAFEDDTETLKNTNVEVSADYYFNRRLSAGIGIEKSSGDDESSEGMSYSANTRFFITPRFSIEAGYDRFLNSNDGFTDEWSYDLTLAGRF